MGAPGGGFGFSAITPELMAMSEELEALGGGDACVGTTQVVCKVAFSQADCTIVYPEGNTAVSVRDPRCPHDTAASQALRRYRLPVFAAEDSGGMIDSASKEAVEWVLSGFNFTALAYGQAGTGKTSSLLGRDHSPSLSDPSFLSSFVRELFRRTAATGAWRVCLSCWEMVGGDDAVDLLGDTPGRQTSPLGAAGTRQALTCVEVATVDDFEDILRFSRLRSCNWGGRPGPGAAAGGLSALPNRAHAFLRIIVHNSTSRCESQLHVVDLVGNRPMEGPGSAGADPLSQSERERRMLNRQMLAFSRVISELAQRNGVIAGGSLVVAAARDTKLTSMLAPIIASNTKTLLLVSVSSRADDYVDTINTLRIANRAQSLKVACMRSVNGAQVPQWTSKETAVGLLSQIAAEKRRQQHGGDNGEDKRHTSELRPYAQRQYGSDGWKSPQTAPALAPGGMPSSTAESGPQAEALSPHKATRAQPRPLPDWDTVLKQAEGSTLGATDQHTDAAVGSAQTSRPSGQSAQRSSAASGSHSSRHTNRPSQAGSRDSKPATPGSSFPLEAAANSGYRSVTSAAPRAAKSYSELHAQRNGDFLSPSMTPYELPSPYRVSPDPLHSHTRKGLSTPLTDRTNQMHGQYPGEASLTSGHKTSQTDRHTPPYSQWDDVSRSYTANADTSTYGTSALYAQPGARHGSQLQGQGLSGMAPAADLSDSLAPEASLQSLAGVSWRPQFDPIGPETSNPGTSGSYGRSAAYQQSSKPPKSFSVANAEQGSEVSGTSGSWAGRGLISRPDYSAQPGSMVSSGQRSQLPGATARLDGLKVCPPHLSRTGLPARPRLTGAGHGDNQGDFHDIYASIQPGGGASQMGRGPSPPGHPRPYPEPYMPSGSRATPSDVPSSSYHQYGEQSPGMETHEGAAGHPPLGEARPAEEDSYASHDASTVSASTVPSARPGAPDGTFSEALQGEVKALKGQNEWLVGLLEHQKKVSEALKDKMKEMEVDMNELSTQYEVQLNTAKMESLEMRSRCRKLQAESEFANVFDNYEKEIQSLQESMSQLRDENSQLLKMISSLQMRNDAQLSPQPQPGQRMSGSAKLLALQRQLRRTEVEREKAIKALGDMKHKGRSADLQRSQYDDMVRKMQEMHRLMAQREQEATDRGLAAAEASGKTEMLQVELARLQESHSALQDENRSLQGSVHSLREVVANLRKPKRRELVEASLPPVPPLAPGRNPRSRPRALDLIRLVEKEIPGNNPRVGELMQRLTTEVMGVVQAQEVMARREATLMHILTGEHGL